MNESSDLVESVEEAEEERVNDGRGLLFVGWDAKYDAGLNDRLAMAVGFTVPPYSGFYETVEAKDR